MQARPQLVVQSYGVTDTGACRTHNEDRFLLDDALGLYLVADGMGGHQAGEVAAELTVQTVHACMSLPPEALPPCDRDPTLSPQANALRAAILGAHATIKAQALDSPDMQGMGSTLAAVYVHRTVLVAANVGDSPIYLLRDGVLRELSIPHTVATEQAAFTSTLPLRLQEKYANMLTRAMGTREEALPDFFETLPRPNDTLLLCSDGLSNKVSSDELQQILLSRGPRQACEELLAIALARGGEDNITCLALRLVLA